MNTRTLYLILWIGGYAAIIVAVLFFRSNRIVGIPIFASGGVLIAIANFVRLRFLKKS